MIVRAFIISNIAKTVSASLLKEYFNTYLFPSLKGPMLIDLNSAGVIYLGFSDVVDSDAAIHKARTLCPEWNVEMFSPTQLAHKFGSMPLSNEDGQLVVKAFFAGPPADFSPTAVEQLLLELLSNYGDVLSYQSLHDNEANTICLVVEFDDKYTAESAARALNGFKIQGCRLSIPGSNPNSGAVAASRRIELAHGGSEIDSAFNRLSVSSRQYSRNEQAGRLVGRGYVRLSPTGRSTLPPEDLPNSWTSDYAYTQPNLSRGRSRPEPLLSSGNVGRYREDHRSPGPWEVHGAIGQERSQLQHLRFPHIANSSSRQLTTKLTGRCDQDFASGHHNVVDIERIRRGLDVRTTIMLRNIPNKIDQAMLKDIVDETSIGKYDFMYLRIDFANNCNVGYAFINFEDPYFIIDFVETRAGRRWNRFNSDKVAEVSYATIQGKDCLVQKFRNSSVMLEHPSFRPKIFHTGTSPLAGKEDAFPCPDNPSKMRRSVENAEHVGLFAPRAGQQNRDEQRRRRSQFDRGTRLAEYEEAYEYDSQDDDDNYHSQDLRYGPLEERPLAHRTSRYGMSY
ncbi:MAG: hypothetical protein M1833_005950 [Piccolia ochrophora]|nr:MAG: hypothetical protein M1833_005950 [Piccolia ochrophora]